MAEPHTTTQQPPGAFDPGPDGADMLAEHEAAKYTRGNHAASLLDQLGALRQQRADETVTDLALPGYNARLWANVRLPDAAKATRLTALMAAGDAALTGVAMEIVAEAVKGLYLADSGAEPPILLDGGGLAVGFDHLPGGTDLQPVNFADARLERVPQLCPPRAGGKAHDDRTRVRALFGRDALVIGMAMSVAGWALGMGGKPGALERLSEQFTGE